MSLEPEGLTCMDKNLLRKEVRAMVLTANEANPNDSNGDGSNGTHRRIFLVDSDVAAGKSGAGGITVAQRDRYGVQYSWLSVISHTHIEHFACGGEAVAKIPFTGSGSTWSRQEHGT